MRWALLTLMLALYGQATAQQTNYQHAAQLYQSVAAGQRSMGSLTPQERQQVLLIARAIRSSCSSNSHKCQTVCNAANELESSSQDLAQCASQHDYSDSCDSQFSAVRDAHDDLETAVADADGDCD